MRWDYLEFSGWVINPMVNVLIRDRKGDRHREKATWLWRKRSEKAASQDTPEATRGWKRQVSPSEGLRSINKLMGDFDMQNCEGISSGW